MHCAGFGIIKAFFLYLDLNFGYLPRYLFFFLSLYFTFYVLSHLLYRSGMTALHLAGQHDNSGTCLQLLLEHNADINIHNDKVKLLRDITN